MIKFCKKCIMPNTRPRIIFDNMGVCNACLHSEKKKIIDWDRRKQDFLKLVDRIKEREKSLLKNVGDTKELPSGVISDMSEYIGGNRKTKKNKKNTSRKKVNKKSKK